MSPAFASIGLDGEKRTEDGLRPIFVEAFHLIEHCLDEQGRWLSLTHECLAHDALQARFPDLQGNRLFAVIANVASVRASGRCPVD